MRKVIFTSMLLLAFETYSQTSYRQINIKRRIIHSEITSFNNDSADQMLRIVSYVYRSHEFQDTISKIEFTIDNNCGNINRKNKIITGKEVLDTLFKRTDREITLYLKRVGKPPFLGHCWSLGNTPPRGDSIASYYKNIDCLMGGDLPFMYAYATHVCHEFMHNLGYCHTDHSSKDIAEEIGNIAFYFITKWYKTGRI